MRILIVVLATSLMPLTTEAATVITNPAAQTRSSLHTDTNLNKKPTAARLDVFLLAKASVEMDKLRPDHSGFGKMFAQVYSPKEKVWLPRVASLKGGRVEFNLPLSTSEKLIQAGGKAQGVANVPLRKIPAPPTFWIFLSVTLLPIVSKSYRRAAHIGYYRPLALLWRYARKPPIL